MGTRRGRARRGRRGGAMGVPVGDEVDPLYAKDLS